MGLQQSTTPSPPLGRKRKRKTGSWLSVRPLPNISVFDVILRFQEDEMTEDEHGLVPVEPEKKEETQLMAVRTVIFGTGFAGDMRLGYVLENVWMFC